MACAMCGKPTIPGVNSDFCSLGCEKDYEAEEAIDASYEVHAQECGVREGRACNCSLDMRDGFEGTRCVAEDECAYCGIEIPEPGYCSYECRRIDQADIQADDAINDEREHGEGR